MNIYTFFQKGSSTSHWVSQYIKGIKFEARRKGNEAIIIEYGGDTDEIPQELTVAECAIVVVGTNSWTKSICQTLLSMNVKPIVAGCDADEDVKATSHVLMDYEKATTDILHYFDLCHKRKIALFAVNLQSPADKLKLKSFLSYVNSKGEKSDMRDVFYFRGNTENTCESFISVCKEYDAVIGTNDVSTVILLRMLAANGIKAPDSLFVASFGDSSLSKSTTSELTLALLDCYAVGVHAVKMHSLITNSGCVSNSVIKLECDIDVRNSSANIPISRTRSKPGRKQENSHISFLEDPYISKIVLAEYLLKKCDTIDMDIMKALLSKEKYIDIAEKLHVSESTVKYRIKRLLSFAKLNSRYELTDLMKTYLT